MDLQNLFGTVVSAPVNLVSKFESGVSNVVGNAVNRIVGNPPARGSINEFKASFKKDVARPNRFDVNIPVPLGLLLNLTTARNLNYRCENASFPGKNLATLEQKTYGPIEKYPYLTTFTDIDLTFIVDDDMAQKNFFDRWLNYINPQSTYNMRYKSQYSTGLTINQYDVTNQLTYSVTLYDAFPIAMQQLDLDWNNDGYHKLVVTFAFTTWQNNTIQEAVSSLFQNALDL
jgi:hypothetical protein